MKNISRKLIFIAAFVALGFAGSARAATLFMVPSAKDAAVGDTFTVSVRIGSEDRTVNAAEGVIRFSRDTLEAVQVGRADSIFNIWLTDPQINSTAGEISFLGGSTNAFSGRSMQVFTITFRARGTGTANIDLRDAAVTSGDGTGANILTATEPLQLSIRAAGTAPAVQPPAQITRPEVPAAALPGKPSVKVPLFPDAARWYNFSAAFEASWDLPREITEVAAVLNKTADYVPTKGEGLITGKQFAELADGIWYLHVRFRDSVGWGETAHVRIAIDTVPPASFAVSSRDGAETGNPRPSIAFHSGDALSGLANYGIYIDGQLATTTAVSVYTLPTEGPGDHIIRVRANDQAGNATESILQLKILPIPAPEINPVQGTFFVGEGGIIASGSGTPGETILVNLRSTDRSGVNFGGPAMVNRNGSWVFRFDQPLRKGDYVMEARAQNAQGATSFPVEAPGFTVRERPIFTIGGLEVTLGWFTMFLVLALAGVFAGGMWFEKRRDVQMGERSLIVQRDLVAVADLIRKEALRTAEILKKGRLGEGELADLRHSAHNVEENADKLEKYVVEGVQKIPH